VVKKTRSSLGLKVISVEERFEQHGIRRDWINPVRMMQP